MLEQHKHTAAALDWFSVSFFSAVAIVFWIVYLSMHIGVPTQPAANVARLAPGYTAHFSPFALALASVGTAAWMWLVKWRTGSTRHPLWKSLVLPASGVTLAWMLVMTLLLPPVDQARSYRSIVGRIAQWVPRDSCISAPGVPRAQIVALEYLGGYRVDATNPVAATHCNFLLQAETLKSPSAPGIDWTLRVRERRNTNEDEITAVYSRSLSAR